MPIWIFHIVSTEDFPSPAISYFDQHGFAMCFPIENQLLVFPTRGVCASGMKEVSICLKQSCL